MSPFAIIKVQTYLYRSKYAQVTRKYIFLYMHSAFTITLEERIFADAKMSKIELVIYITDDTREHHTSCFTPQVCDLLPSRSTTV